ANPTYRKVNPADAPIMIFGLTSTVYDRGTLYDAASTIMQQRLSQIQGVGQVNVGGSSLPAVRVELNPTQLNSYGLGLQTVASMLNAQNANEAKGTIANDQTTADITTNDQLLKAEYYKPLIVGYHNGAAIKLSDIADVQDSTQNIRATGYVNGKPAVLVIVYRMPGANIIDTVDRIQDAVPSLKASIPTAIDLTVVLDRTTTIRASVRDVERTLIISIVLVILVVFFFLRNARATFIPSVAVPVSLIGTFGVMYLLGYSLDNLSLMALTISTGFVVDDAIVVIENISRYREQGMNPFDAAVRGAREIGFTVVSISVSLVAVFIPILLMGGIVGRLFREFAVTLSTAVAVSMVVSLTTTPMMCAKLLRPEREETRGRFYRVSQRVFDGALSQYETGLKWVLRHLRLTLAISLATLALSVYLFAVIPKGFFPQQDTGRLMGAILADQDTSFQAMRDRLTVFVNTIKADPAVEHVIGFAGGSGRAGATNTARMFIALKPLGPRKISADQVIARLRKKTSHIEGATLYLQAVQDLRVGGRSGNALYQYTLQGSV